MAYLQNIYYPICRGTPWMRRACAMVFRDRVMVFRGRAMAVRDHAMVNPWSCHEWMPW